MPRPFGHTFNALYRKLPFSDTARTRARLFIEALRREFVGPTASGLDLLTEADEVYDAIFIPSASGTDLDEWGAVMNLPRLPAEGDAAYRVRLLAVIYQANNCLTVQAVTDVVNTLGATYTPAISVVRVHEYYKPYYAAPQWGRRADGVTPGDDCIGEDFGLSHLDYLTYGIELNRSPSTAEAEALAEAVRDIQPAQSRGQIITDMGIAPPPRYRMHSYAFSHHLAPLTWDDEISQPAVTPVTDRYANLMGGGAGWAYVGPPFELFGDASLNGSPDVLVPRQDVVPPVIDEKNIYMIADCYFTSAGTASGHFAGFAFRVQASNAFYCVVFRTAAGPTWRWGIQRWTGAAWVVELAFADTGIDMSLMRTVEIWIRGDTLFTVRVDGVVLATEYDVGPDIVLPGQTGFITRGTQIDMNVDYFRYW